MLLLPSNLFQDASTKILDILEGKPDLIIGNYTDGNLVASLMSSKLGVTQVRKLSNHIGSIKVSFGTQHNWPDIPEQSSWQGTIAHALEKTKYVDSDVKWRELDQKYHFSCQFTADMIAMNNTDFIITSTYQEIAGRSVAWILM